MDSYQFDDSQASGIWWSTNVAIRDACAELKEETSCFDKDIANLLRSIAISIENDGI